MTEPAIDGTAVADTPADEAPPVPPEPSTEVVLAAPGSGAIIAAEQPEEILAKAQQIAAPLAQLIESAGLAVSLDRRNPNRKHVEVGGWQAAGTMLGALGGQALHAETVWTRPARDPATGDAIRRTYTAEVKRYHSKASGGGLRETVTYDVDGYDWEACVEIRTASGIVVGKAEAMCSRAESTWAQRDDYAIRSMAETRAESRAYRRAIGWIVHMAGYNPTPAEEMGHTPGAAQPPEVPWWAEPASEDRKKQALDAVEAILGGDRDGARVLLKTIADQLGVMPDLIPAAVKILAVSVESRSQPNPAPEPETGSQGPA